MTEERLREVRSAFKEREQLMGKIKELETMRISPRIAAYGTERVQTSAKGDVQPEAIAKIDEAIAEYNKQLARCIELLAEFEEAIKILTARERIIMRYYYVDGLTWERVCVETGLSWTRLHQYRRKAVEKIAG